jgi:hypothetical protein
MWALREIECDITVGLYYPLLGSDTAVPFQSWYDSTQERLDAWYQTVKQSVTLTEKIEFHELLFQIQVLRLNRPSPRCGRPSSAMRKKGLKSCITLIKEFHVLDRLGKMFMLWHAAHCIVEAGVYLLAFILQSIETADRRQQHLDGEEISILVRYVTHFKGLLSNLSRRWPSVGEHASALSGMSASVLSLLDQWSDRDGPSSGDCAALLQELQDKWNMISTVPTPDEYSRYPQEGGSYDQSIHARNLANGADGPTLNAIPLQHHEMVGSSSLNWATDNSTIFDSSFPAAAESYALNYNDPMAWDFSGLDSEEIFAAMLDFDGSGLGASAMYQLAP